MFRKSIVLLATSFLLLNCTSNDSKEASKEVRNVTTEELFNLNYETYLVYFYSESCGHCHRIKNKITEFSISTIYDFYYFDVEKSDISYGKDRDNLIGCNLLSDFYILGTPSLVLFDNNAVSNYYLGESEIVEYIIAAK